MDATKKPHSELVKLRRSLSKILADKPAKPLKFCPFCRFVRPAPPITEFYVNGIIEAMAPNYDAATTRAQVSTLKAWGATNQQIISQIPLVREFQKDRYDKVIQDDRLLAHSHHRQQMEGENEKYSVQGQKQRRR